jgi:hypothetical protein
MTFWIWLPSLAQAAGARGKPAANSKVESAVWHAYPYLLPKEWFVLNQLPHFGHFLESANDLCSRSYPQLEHGCGLPRNE